MSVQYTEIADDEAFEITPLIDVVFLLLAYFIMTATILQEEADLSINLPAEVRPVTPTEQPEELIIDIHASGQVEVNGVVVDSPDAREMPELRSMLTRTKLLAENMGTRAMVVIQANDDSQHQRTIDVLNACAGARIRFVTFGSPSS